MAGTQTDGTAGPGAVRPEARSVVLDAAARLLSSRGVDAVTTRAVAQEAGVQAPTLYRLFGDKDGLLDALAERVMATYVAATAAAAADEEREGGDPVADLRSAWDAHVAFGLAHPDLYALLTARALPRPSAATAAGVDVLRRRLHRLAVAGRLRVDERRALLMVHAAGSGTVLALRGRPAGTGDEGLPDAMFAAVAAQVLDDAPAAVAAPGAPAVAFATTVPTLPGLSEAERGLLAEWLDRSARSHDDEGTHSPD